MPFLVFKLCRPTKSNFTAFQTYDLTSHITQKIELRSVLLIQFSTVKVVFFLGEMFVFTFEVKKKPIFVFWLKKRVQGRPSMLFPTDVSQKNDFPIHSK